MSERKVVTKEGRVALSPCVEAAEGLVLSEPCSLTS